MYKILRREDLSSNVVLMDVEAPMCGQKVPARPVHHPARQ